MKKLIYLVVIIVLLVIFYFYQNRDLKILTFETQKAQYDIDDDIIFNVQVNRSAYVYLYTYNDKDVRKLLYPKNFSDKYQLGADQIGVIDNIKVKPKEEDKQLYKDEKVLLVVAINPILSAKKEMTRKSFTKMLEGNENTSMTIIDKKQQKKHLFITIPIRKPIQKVTIETQSNAYKQGEDIDLDINSLNDGYVWVFEATPTGNITKLNSGKIDKNRRFPTGTVGKSPNGHHTAIAIYTKENTPLGVDDFTIIKGETIKGEPTFEVKFKNGKDYAYNIETFKVTN